VSDPADGGAPNGGAPVGAALVGGAPADAAAGPEVAPEPAPVLRHRTLHRFARRLVNPFVLRAGLAGGRRSPIGLVLTIGRRSGRRYATPLAVHRRGDLLFIPLTYGPGARWCQNVQARGSCSVRLRGRDLAAGRPRLLRRADLPRTLRSAYRPIGIDDFLELTILVESVIGGERDEAGPGRSGGRPSRRRSA
jgi:deazaflavin-dependent oxidoreductase (nitroreductase family)